MAIEIDQNTKVGRAVKKIKRIAFLVAFVAVVTVFIIIAVSNKG